MIEQKLADDLLIGAEAIAEWHGLPLRSTYWRLEQGEIKAFKIGQQWAARKSTLLADIERREKEALVG